MESGGTQMISKGRTVYRIVVRSELDERYAVAFEGMEMETKHGVYGPHGRDHRPAASLRHPRSHKRSGTGATERAGLAGRYPPGRWRKTRAEGA